MRPQHLLVVHNSGESGGETRDIEVAVQGDSGRYVIGRAAWGELVDQPELLLAKGERLTGSQSRPSPYHLLPEVVRPRDNPGAEPLLPELRRARESFGEDSQRQ